MSRPSWTRYVVGAGEENARADLKHGDTSACFGRIEDAIGGEPGDLGKLYPLDERVRCVIAALKKQIDEVREEARWSL